jgi:hypothetical protein
MRRLEAENFTDDHISVVFPTTGALRLPGLGAFIAAGPIIAALHRATSEVTAGIAAGLAALGVGQSQAQRCQAQLEDGNFLLSVHAASETEAERARQILRAMGAQDICEPEETGFRAAGLAPVG